MVSMQEWAERVDAGTLDELAVAEQFFGPDATVTIGGNTRAAGVAAFFVQHQTVSAGAASRWFTQAVYCSREGAELAMERWEGAGSRIVKAPLSAVDPATGLLDAAEAVEISDQPVIVYRVASLLDLLREGPDAVAGAMFDLVTSDHEWTISTRIGGVEAMALVMSELEDDEDDDA